MFQLEDPWRQIELAIAHTREDPETIVRRFMDEYDLLCDAIDRDAFLKSQVSPPSSAILSSLLPTKVSEDVIANLNELFSKRWVPRHGPQVARRIWKIQAAMVVARRWVEPLLSFVLRARRLIGS